MTIPNTSEHTQSDTILSSQCIFRVLSSYNYWVAQIRPRWPQQTPARPSDKLGGIAYAD